MAITKNLVVTLKDDVVELKDKMFIFRNDVGVEMIIELKDFEYSIDAIGNKNNFSKVSAIFRTPSGKLYSYNDIKVSNGKIRFVFTQDLINVMQEIGEYELQFQLYDKLNNRLTIPSYNFYVKEPLSLPNEAIVGEGRVGFSYVAEDETYLFSIENGYIKTEWEAGDLITKEKLNKIENAIFDAVNIINNMDITNNNPNLGNQHTHNNMGILNTITADKINQWDNKSDFDGNYNNLTNKPPIPTEISDLTNDVGYLTSIPNDYVTDSELNSKGYLTEHQDISGKVGFKVVGEGITVPPINGGSSNDYVLPIATKTTLGGVKIGNNLSIDGNGVLSATAENYDDTEIRELINETNASLDDIASQLSDDLATKDYVDEAINNAKLEGGDVPIDLSAYAKKTDLDDYVTDSELNSKGYLTEHQDISGKVDKVNGKSLISDAEINRLATLENYDDSEIHELINETNTSLEKSVKFKVVGEGITVPPIDILPIASKSTLGVVKIGNNLSIDSNGVLSATLPNDLATKDYVDEAINNAKLEGGDVQVDLSAYAKKTDLHDHSNKTVLDSITTSKVNQWDNKSDFSGNYNDLTNKPTIPTKVSELTNDEGYLTSIPSEYITESELNDKGYLTQHQDISGKADKTELHSHSNKNVLDGITTDKITEWNNKSTFDGNYNSLTNKPTIPTKVSDLNNDVGYLTSIPNDYVTDSELNSKGYLTEHQDISGKADKTELHSHSNKGVLDGITTNKITEWDSKSTFSGNYNDLTNKPTIPTIPSSLPANGGNSDTVDNYHIWVGTQANYNAISSKSNTTIYIIVG